MCVCVRALVFLSLAGWSLPGVCEVSSLPAPATTTGGSGGGGEAEGAPVFLRGAGTGAGTVVAARGDHVTLECRVLHQHDKMVSWVRSRDLQILAAAGAVFTGDVRVTTSSEADIASSGASSGAVRHTLSIAGVRDTDAGRYECQVNTEPKMSQFYNLIVLDSGGPAVKVQISGAREQHCRSGDTVRLHCSALYQSIPSGGEDLPPLEPRWYRGEEPIDLQNPWGGVSLESRSWSGGARSTLLVGGEQSEGGYTCRAGGSADTVNVIVTRDEGEMDAMQRDQSVPVGVARTSAGVSSLQLAPVSSLCVLLVTWLT